MSRSRRHWIWVALIGVVLVAAVGGIITICVLYSEKSKLPYNYGIGIDAGSSSTNLYIYQWPTDKENGTGRVSQIASCPNSSSEPKLPPLSNFASNPSEAGDQTIKSCLERALRIVPITDHSATPVLLGATAGMRLLNMTDNRSADLIMESVRQTISLYPFKISQPLQEVRIIDGREEGIFGWIASNYLSGSFESGRTVGAMDMGGASTQMTFYSPSHETIGYDTWVRLYGYDYRVYTHSYMCYGLDEANRKYKALLVQMQNFSANINDPCAPAGNETVWPFTRVFADPCTPFPELPGHLSASEVRTRTFVFSGSSDSKLCRDLTRKIFNSSADCPQPPCTFNGISQPPLVGDYHAFAGFYFVVRDLGLNVKAGFSLTDYRRAMDDFCNKPWSQISGLPKIGSAVLVILCFQSHYIHHLLVDIYGFNDSNWNSIKFVSKINGTDSGWVFGMMLKATNAIPSHEYVTLVSGGLFVPILVVCSLLVVFGLTVGLVFLVIFIRRKSPTNL